MAKIKPKIDKTERKKMFLLKYTNLWPWAKSF